jgi:hypothetical protein
VARSCARSRALLKPAVSRFEALQSIQQLEPGFACRIRVRPELFGVFDGETDPIDCDAGLVGHLEFVTVQVVGAVLSSEGTAWVLRCERMAVPR